MVLDPVPEQVVNDGVEPFLGRIPGLEQVVVELDVVDRLDRHVGVCVRSEKQGFRAGRVDPRLLEHLDAGHLRHPLVRRDQGHRLVTERELAQHSQRLRPRRSTDDAVVGTVLVGQIAGDRRRDLRIVVDRQDRRFAHETAFGRQGRSQGTRVAQLHHVEHRGGTAPKEVSRRRAGAGSRGSRRMACAVAHTCRRERGIRVLRTAGPMVWLCRTAGRRACSYAASPRT